ncbi:MAG TPA: hypothetical protein DCF99_06070 [Flavobacteriaceae bacterium]|nr:hypothetical protein [Flavobacteriaceae bacterium]
MAKINLSQEQIDYIITQSQLKSGKKIANDLGFSVEVVKRIFRENNIKISREQSLKFRSESKKGQTTFTTEEDEFIRENYLKIPVKTIATILSRSYCGVSGRLSEMNLIIPEEIIEQRKKDSFYKKGEKPWNTGKKLTEEQRQKIEHTWFKKGNIPGNAKKDGEEVIRKDSKGREYWLIKVPEKTKLTEKHKWLWEKHNGKIPKGNNVVFINGNTLDCRIENLECITDAELMERNSVQRFPKDLRDIILLKGKLTRQINKYS